jgi:hypothetical protein
MRSERVTRPARLAWPVLLMSLAGCATGPVWQQDLGVALRQARTAGADTVVFFARPGVPESDRTVPQLADPRVAGALRAGGFVAVVVDAAAHDRLVPVWVGGRDGFGTAVVDAAGQPYAARPGPMDADEFAAFVRLCTARRGEFASLRQAAEQGGPTEHHAFGCLCLELGARAPAETHLVQAALGGVVDARRRLAHLFALDGNLTTARRWLAGAPPTPAAQATEGYLLWKERRYDDAARVLQAALATGQLGAERQRAVLFLAKAWHDARRDDRAEPLLVALVAEGTGSLAEAQAAHVLRHLRDGAAH